jgi:cytoskeleton protein RodZ
MSTSKEIASDRGSPTETTGSTESLGAWLARTRASYGAEPHAMARQLGLNPTIILALEADDFARLGPPIFVRGYLSLYARLLDLPEAAVLERYREQSDASREPPPLKVMHSQDRQTRVRDLRGFIYLLVVIGLGWTAIRHLDALDPGRLLAWWPRNEQAGAPPSASKPMAATTQTQYPFQATPAEATRESSPPAPSEPPPAPSEPPPAPSPEPASASALALALPPAPAASEPTTEAGVASVIPALAPAALEETGGSSIPDAPSGARLMLQFSEDCWVQVKDAQGKVLVNGLMKANTTTALSGPAPFTVTLGNAPAARIALDDRLVDTAVYVPRRGTVSRFTLNAQP